MRDEEYRRRKSQMTDPLTEAYSRARGNYHNAQRHLEAVETKLRKRLKQVHAAQVELEQQEAGLPRLKDDLEKAKAKLAAARDVYRPLREKWKASR
ncbi:MAG TPA: hypothetical protein VKS44_15705 [Candidatus Acidoferrales bacterium]|nr:hypothetical protein [Candidatus Acidoferrales bacterium]